MVNSQGASEFNHCDLHRYCGERITYPQHITFGTLMRSTRGCQCHHPPSFHGCSSGATATRILLCVHDGISCKAGRMCDGAITLPAQDLRFCMRRRMLWINYRNISSYLDSGHAWRYFKENYINIWKDFLINYGRGKQSEQPQPLHQLKAPIITQQDLPWFVSSASSLHLRGN